MKKIGVFTSTRADYGLLFHLMKELSEDPRCELHLLVTGTHLSKTHGLTAELIDRNIFKEIHEFSVDTDKSEPEIFAETLKKASEVLSDLSLNACVILGDRFEALAFALASFMENVPITHLHGGELTFGAKDDAYRHSITKLAKLHLTAHKEYSQRVIQLGENPESVFTTGPFGLDYLKKFKPKSLKALSQELEFNPLEKNILITLHSETHALGDVKKSIDALLSALEKIGNCGYFFTMPNMDEGGKIIRKAIEDFCEKNVDIARAFENLGSINYLSFMGYMDAVVGNSSSGIYEAPYLKIPTLNLGKRQEGRIKGKTVIDSSFNVQEITEKLNFILNQKQHIISAATYPFESIDSSRKAKDIILAYDFSPLKRFYDASK